MRMPLPFGRGILIEPPKTSTKSHQLYYLGRLPVSRARAVGIYKVALRTPLAAAGIYIGVQNSETWRCVLKHYPIGGTPPRDIYPYTVDVAVAPPRRLRRRRRDNQAALIAWLDEQERLLRMRGPPDEVVQEFDPLHNLPEPQGDDVEQGRRTILFRFT